VLCEERGTGRERICDEDDRLSRGRAEEPGFIAERYSAPECKRSGMTSVNVISLAKQGTAVFSDAHHLKNFQAVKMTL
jgi:hypothetical protein